MDTETLIRTALLTFPEGIMEQFVAQFPDEIERCVRVLGEAYDKWKALDKRTGGDEDFALLSSLVYSAINHHVISTHLFLSGNLVASGNIARQVIEFIAMALLGTRPNWGYVRNYSEGRFSSNKALDLVLKKQRVLRLSEDGIQALRKIRDFYHQYSHPSMLATAAALSNVQRGGLYLGQSFDPGKTDAYRREMTVRINLATAVSGLVDWVSENAKSATDA